MPIAPAQLNARLKEAAVHQKAGRFARAEGIYRQLSASAPGVARVFELWGELAEQLHRPDDAMRLYAQACRLQPTDVTLAVRLASVSIALGRLVDAEKTMSGLTARTPRDANAWNAFGFVRKLRGDLLGAAACHEKAVTLNPAFVEGWVQLGLVHALMDRNYEALRQYERALALNPNHALAQYARAEALHKLYRVDEAIVGYDKFLRIEPGNVEARSFRLFAMQNLEGISRERLFQEHCDFGRLLGEGRGLLEQYDPSPGRRLRLAVYSPDLRTHSCAYFLEPLLQGLDPAEFELYLYHDHLLEDAVSERFKRYAAVWRNFVGQSNAVVERTIREDRPDILLDLAGHVAAGARLQVFAHRVAPVQITYLGYPDTTGVRAMDFRLTDAVADPPGDSDQFVVEKLVRFAPVAWAYLPPTDAPAVAPLPCASGRPITFGCFNNPTKFTDVILRAWAQILTRVADSRLVLKGRDFHEGPVREHMMSRLRIQGVPCERIDLLPRTATTAEHLHQYGGVDIALDTFPYNGTTTTCEALWMGRPVVTLCGDRHASRVGASLLTSVGHPEWIASSSDGYVDLAVTLAEKSADLAGASLRLRDDLLRSPLLDHPAQRAAFTRALRACWHAKIPSCGQPE